MDNVKLLNESSCLISFTGMSKLCESGQCMLWLNKKPYDKIHVLQQLQAISWSCSWGCFCRQHSSTGIWDINLV